MPDLGTFVGKYFEIPSNMVSVGSYAACTIVSAQGDEPNQLVSYAYASILIYTSTSANDFALSTTTEYNGVMQQYLSDRNSGGQKFDLAQPNRLKVRLAYSTSTVSGLPGNLSIELTWLDFGNDVAYLEPVGA